MIGYTFYAVKFWGTGINPIVKKLMMDYIFQYVDKIYFHVGVHNYRSQEAVSRLGAVKIKEEKVADHINFLYALNRKDYFR